LSISFRRIIHEKEGKEHTDTGSFNPHLSFSFPSSRGKLGLGISYVDMGSIEGRDEEGNPTGDFTASDTHIFIGYAKRFKKISWGISLGWLEDTIKNDKKNVFLGNVGFLYPVNDRLSLGLVGQNIGGKLGYDPLPLTFKLGAASKLKNVVLPLDIAKPQDDEVYYCLGAEWWLKSSFALRAGYKTDQDAGEGWSTGLGFKFGRSDLDYAYVPYGDLGITHRSSLGIKF